ncbi:MAG: DUF4347 domain-containing protein [Reyranellaceae bacterium]
MTELVGFHGYRVVGDAWRIHSAAELVFIDSTVPDPGFLHRHLLPGIGACLLAPDEMAVAQVARYVAGQCNLQKLHLVVHGAPGALQFGSGVLSLETLGRDTALLARIGAALAPDGEIYLWACNTGQGARGAAFVAALARATGVRVIAASTLMGNGTWALDDSEARPPLSPAGIAGYAGVLVNFTATAGNDNPALSTGDDTVTVSNTNQIQAADKFEGDTGTDAIQIGTAAAGTSIDLSAAANDGVNGFLNFEAITFVNTSGTSTATFNAAQFGAGKISTTVAITGNAFTQGIVITVPVGTTFDLSGWTFNSWTSGTDTITITGSTGSETIVGSSADETYVVSATNQVSAGDTYDGGGGTDTLQIGTAAAGTAIDLSAAATDGVKGFLNIEKIAFVNTSGTSTATFSSAQFGAGRILDTATITGNAQINALAFNVVAGGSLDLSKFTYAAWTSGTDTIHGKGRPGARRSPARRTTRPTSSAPPTGLGPGEHVRRGWRDGHAADRDGGGGHGVDLSAAATDGVKAS